MGTVPFGARVEVQSAPVTESENVTVPVGTVRPVSLTDGTVTAAFRVKGWLTTAGLPAGVGAIEVMLMAVLVFETTCDSMSEEVVKFESPVYVAVTLREPAAVNEALQLAVVTDGVAAVELRVAVHRMTLL